MRICHVVPSLEERHGGPSKSVRALANAQAAKADVTVLSTQEAGHPAADTTVDAARYIVAPRVEPKQLCRSPELRQQLLGQPNQVIHHHSLWLLTLHYAHEAARQSGVPLVISPRGMLSDWAYRHHYWRKKLAGWLVHPGAFSSAAGWHATSQEEADDVRRMGFSQPVCIAPNGVSMPDQFQLAAARSVWLQAHPRLKDRRIAVFYSRLHRKKRVRELVDLWTSRSRDGWVLLLAGLPEEYSIAELASRVAGSRTADSIVIADSTGMPPPYAVGELFLLPSHSENFGLVIVEALAAGLPALVTNTTPWRGLERENAGRCVPWSEYGPMLDHLLKSSPAELSALGARGRAWASRDFVWEHTAGLLIEFYRNLGHGR